MVVLKDVCVIRIVESVGKSIREDELNSLKSFEISPAYESKALRDLIRDGKLHDIE